MEMKGLIHAFKKQIKVVVAIVVFCTICGVVISYSIPSTYEAKTDLLINSTASNTENTSAVMGEIDANLRLIETYKQILRSDRLVSKVNTELGEVDSRSVLASKVKIHADGGSQIITIVTTDRTAEKAADLANMYAKVFQEEIKTLMSLENITILKNVSAGVDTRTIEPAKFIFIFSALLIGVLTSLVYVIVKEVYFPLLDSNDKVENVLQAPFLGAIISDKKEKRKKKQKRTINNQRIDEFPRAAEEDFSRLATNVHHLAKEKAVKTIMLASSQTGDGKTFIGYNLAVKLAMNGQKTLFLDANLRKSDGRKLFNLPERKGLTSIISGFYKINEVVQQTAVENLSFIGTGPLPPNPDRFLQSDNMNKIMAELKDSYDVIIIDSSALMMSDAVSLLPATDSCIYITDVLKTKEDKAVQSLESLKKVGGDILGVVLNGKKGKKVRIA